MRRRALLACVAALLLLPAGAAHAVPLPEGSTALLSGTSSLFGQLPAPVGVSSITSSAASQDGRIVAFQSRSDGLLAGDDDYVSNVYVKDTSTGVVTLVSRATGAAGEPAHRDCYDASIDDAGTRVAFACVGSLDPADGNGQGDVYVRDLSSGTTTLASRASSLGPVGDQGASNPSISGGGQYVAFQSISSNLHPNATGNDLRVFRRELGGGNVTSVVSRKTGDQGAVVRGSKPSISAGGNFVAFVHPGGSDTPDADDTNNASDVYVRNVDAGTTTLVSRKDGFGGDVANAGSDNPALSGDGSAVAFESAASNLDPNDIDSDTDIYRRGLATGTTRLVNANNEGAKSGSARAPSIDHGGMKVGFVSSAVNLSPDDTDPSFDGYVADLEANVTHLVSRADGVRGTAANGGALQIAVSGDGDRAVTRLLSGAVFPGADTRQSALLWRDIAAERSLSVARPPGDAPFVSTGGSGYMSSLSADGRYAAFISEAPGLGLRPGVQSAVFVRDRVSGSVVLASRADGAAGEPMKLDSVAPAISADGRRVAFAADSGSGALYVRDIVQGRTYLASRADGAAGAPANGSSFAPHLDADGTRVVFGSYATNLGDGDTDGRPDIHVRDLASGRTLLVSRANGAAGAKGNDESGDPDINADGTRVAFASIATNLADGDTDASADIHLRDLSAGTTRLVSAAAGGPKANQPAFAPSIDASGSRVAFEAASTNLAGDTLPRYKVFVRDMSTGSLVIASRLDGAAGAVADGNPRAARISPDGGFVAFTAAAGNLAPALPDDLTQAFVRDLAAGRTELVSRAGGVAGAASTREAEAEDLSLDGGCVSFRTNGNLVGPASEYTQVYLRSRRADCAPLRTGGPSADTTAPVLSKVRLTRKRFRVGAAATPRSARAMRGTVLRFRSSEAAKLTIRIDRLRGRRARRAGVLTRAVKAGPGRVALSGRIGKRRMKPGRYRLTLRARDAAGNRSIAVKRTLTILRG